MVNKTSFYVAKKKNYPLETIEIWLSAWIERNFISHSLHSVVALLVIGDFVYL